MTERSVKDKMFFSFMQEFLKKNSENEKKIMKGFYTGENVTIN